MLNVTYANLLTAAIIPSSPLTARMSRAARIVGMNRKTFGAIEKTLIAAGMRVLKVRLAGKKPAKFYVIETIAPALSRAAERGVIGVDQRMPNIEKMKKSE